MRLLYLGLIYSLLSFTASAQANAITTLAKCAEIAVDGSKALARSSKGMIYEKQVTKLTFKDLAYQSKGDNINQLIDKGIDSGKIDLFKMASLRKKYGNIKNGDRILLSCLKQTKCNPEEAATIAQKSELHAMFIERHPTMSLTLVNHKIGQIGESVMTKFFTASGWKQIPGEVGRNGIDGLFVKRDKNGNIIDVIFAESKYNTSRLKLTKADGQQMSKKWLLAKIKRLDEAHPNNPDYKRLRSMVENDQYRARLINTNVKDGQLIVKMKSVHDKGERVALSSVKPGENTKGSFIKNRVINLSNPQGNYQKEIVKIFYAELNK